MTIIEQYINFSFDNDFKIKTKTWLNVDSCKCIWYNKWIVCIKYIRGKSKWYIQINLIQLITSKPFIESITIGVFDNNDLLNKYSNYYYWDLRYFIDKDLEENLENLSNSICKNQAIAIREEKLEDFIINLWIWIKKN